MFFVNIWRNLMWLRRIEFAGAAAVLIAVYLAFPVAIWWVVILVFAWAEMVGLERRTDAERTRVAQDRLAIFKGDEAAALGAFHEATVDTGCSRDEVDWVYRTLQDMMSPMRGPKMVLLAQDDLYGMAYDADDIDLDLTRMMHEDLKRDFSDWDAVTQRVQVKTLADLCVLIGQFPRT